jgi:uncharacterized protein
MTNHVIQDDILKSAKQFAINELSQDHSGHDWWHVYRISQLAKNISLKEGADPFICEMAALLHDIADEKIVGDEQAGLNKVSNWLKGQGVDPQIHDHIMEIISTMSFKGGTNQSTMKTIEGKVVQDADRLDAMGAIGIARTMCYSGFKGRPIHDPNILPREQMTLEEYRNGKDTAINHFYEKLLKLKTRINTETAKQMAESRHQFLTDYLQRFLQEWEGEK